VVAYVLEGACVLVVAFDLKMFLLYPPVICTKVEIEEYSLKKNCLGLEAWTFVVAGQMTCRI
jgi:hypothetical protein